jgi:hypothetical protein
MVTAIPSAIAASALIVAFMISPPNGENAKLLCETISNSHCTSNLAYPLSVL